MSTDCYYTELYRLPQILLRQFSDESLVHVCSICLSPDSLFLKELQGCFWSQGSRACIGSKLLVPGGEGDIHFVWLLLTSMMNFLIVLILPRAFLLFCGFEHLWSPSVFSCMLRATLSDLTARGRHGKFLFPEKKIRTDSVNWFIHWGN